MLENNIIEDHFSIYRENENRAKSDVGQVGGGKNLMNQSLPNFVHSKSEFQESKVKKKN